MFERVGWDIGDCWFFTWEQTVHMYYLTTPTQPGSKRWIIGHASSEDMIHWHTHPDALTQGSTGSFDDGWLATGSVIRHENRFAMVYTGHRKNDSPQDHQRIGIAFSEDLIRWQRHSHKPVLEVDQTWYEQTTSGQRPMVHWRDPCVFQTGDHYTVWISARSNIGQSDERGTVAVATSSDLIHWQIHPPLNHEPFAEELEVPQHYQVGNKHLLLFCTHANLIASRQKNQHPSHTYESADYLMVAEKLDGPYRMVDHGRLFAIKPDPFVYASQLIEFHKQWFCLSTAYMQKRTVITDPIPIRDRLHQITA